LKNSSFDMEVLFLKQVEKPLQEMGKMALKLAENHFVK